MAVKIDFYVSPQKGKDSILFYKALKVQSI